MLHIMEPSPLIAAARALESHTFATRVLDGRALALEARALALETRAFEAPRHCQVPLLGFSACEVVCR